MTYCNNMPFDSRWMDNDSPGTLEQYANAARQEFSELTDSQLKTLWLKLESLLLEWAQVTGVSLPIHKKSFPRRCLDAHSRTESPSAVSVDFVVLFHLVGHYLPLQRFLASLHANAVCSYRKALALLILRESTNDEWSEVRRLARSFDRTACIRSEDLAPN
jgi:hypothetical protein